MVHALGGPTDFVERSVAYLGRAPVILPVEAKRSGYLAACETRELGMAVIALGGGRSHPDDRIDHRVGFDALKPLGTRIEKGDVIAFVHAADQDSAERARHRLYELYTFDDMAPAKRSPILARIT